MVTEASMTFRVDDDLRRSFSEAVVRNHRPAAQVLRELMREYVLTHGGEAVESTIAKAEKKRRLDACNYGKASVFLEGFKPNKDDEELMHRFIAGEIAISDVIEIIHDSANQG